MKKKIVIKIGKERKWKTLDWHWLYLGHTTRRSFGSKSSHWRTLYKRQVIWCSTLPNKTFFMLIIGMATKQSGVWTTLLSSMLCCCCFCWLMMCCCVKLVRKWKFSVFFVVNTKLALMNVNFYKALVLTTGLTAVNALDN